jgi:phosphoglucosamine mutase
VTLRFGTDGVRGVANVDLTPELVVALGRAAARVMGRGRWLVGRDTRLSSPLIEAALAAGLAAEGARVDLLGVAPTPEVAYLSAADGVPAAMISASHNPFPDNGIKFFAAGGLKLTDDTEAELEAELDRLVHGTPTVSDAETQSGAAVGRIASASGLQDRYARAVEASIGGRILAGIRLVLDCSNGSASHLAPQVMQDLGADVIVIGAVPDGTNINEGCGSTHPESLQREVVARDADVGLAFDGDADRVIAVDAEGNIVDGDQIIAVCAVDRHQRGLLEGDTVVVTVMTNLGFRLAMAERGIKVVDTQVGDRYVLQALEEGGWTLGGEQSGHVIFRDLATTGDGILTGLQLLDVMVRSGRSLAELAGVMSRLPQVLRNVHLSTTAADPVGAIADDIRAAEQALGERGRVLVRPSGTEPLVRVMVEAPTAQQAESVADRLVAAIQESAG